MEIQGLNVFHGQVYIYVFSLSNWFIDYSNMVIFSVEVSRLSQSIVKANFDFKDAPKLMLRATYFST